VPQKQNAICKTRAQYAIALLNYLKRIAPQQLMLRTQVSRKKLLSSNFLSKKVTLLKIFVIRRI
jgi:DNA-binding IscR family transcriptional regulator